MSKQDESFEPYTVDEVQRLPEAEARRLAARLLRVEALRIEALGQPDTALHSWTPATVALIARFVIMEQGPLG